MQDGLLPVPEVGRREEGKEDEGEEEDAGGQAEGARQVINIY